MRTTTLRYAVPVARRLRLSRRPSPPTGVAVLAASGRAARRRRRRASGCAGADHTAVRMAPEMEITELETDVLWAETGRWRAIEADLTLRFAPHRGGCSVDVEFEVRGPAPLRPSGWAASARRAARRAQRPAARRPDPRGTDGRLMGRVVALVLAVLMVAVGLLWTFQGLGYIKGSAMTGVEFWAIARSRRRRLRRRPRDRGPAASIDCVALAPIPERGRPVARVVVDVMPKPEILDPQGKAVQGALPAPRLHRGQRGPPGQAVRARDRGRGHRGAAGRGPPDGRDAAVEPGDRGLLRPGGLVKIGRRHLPRLPRRRRRASRRTPRRGGARRAVARRPRPPGGRRRRAARRLLLRRLPALRRDRPVRAGDDRGGRRRPGAACRSSASATASRSCASPTCCPGALIRNDHRKFGCLDQRITSRTTRPPGPRRTTPARS